MTVLGGYLGVGKTTVINRLLDQIDNADPTRIAVLVNDFGTISIDAALISSRSDSVIELSNGCICCSLADGFAATLDQIHQRALADPSAAPHQLLIETSGVALPGTVAQYAHMRGFELGAVIVIVDGEQLPDQLADQYVGATVQAQLSAADLILISKADLLTADQIETISDLLSSMTTTTAISTPSDSELPALLFGPRDPLLSPSLAGSAAQTNLAFELSEICLSSPVVRMSLEHWLGTAPPHVVRVKGIVESGQGLLRVDRVGPRIQTQQYSGQVDRSVVGTLSILSVKAVHPAAEQSLSEWLGESPAKL